MPTYSFRCKCGWEIVKRYTAVPSDEKRKSTACEECGKTAERDYAADIGSVAAVGGQKGTIEKEVGFAMERDRNGRPIYRDVNGNLHEVRNSRDVDAFTVNNAFGKPRMVEFRNPVTGRTSWEPMRQGGLRPHPVTGEPMETTPIVREQAKLVNMGTVQGEYCPPSHTPSGIPIDPATMAAKLPPPEKRNLGLIDPQTGKPMTIADCWGGSEAGVNVGRVENRRPPEGQKWTW